MASSGKVSAIARMNGDEGAVLPSGIHTQPCACALLRAMLAVLEMGTHVPSTVGFQPPEFVQDLAHISRCTQVEQTVKIYNHETQVLTYR